MSVLAQKNILIGVSGGIAAYKIPLLIRQLVKLNSTVKVVMTPSSKEFVTPLTLSTVSKNDVFSEFTTEKNNNPTWNNHVELAEWADIFIIAPATSNTISSMSSARCDNLLLACYLSSNCPVFVAPAMDLEMYKNTLNQKNIKQLVSNDTYVLPVGSGSLASGLEGKGRMLEPDEIIDYVENKFKKTLPLNSLNNSRTYS
jgi:phosphopantothenoylcysteine decarboxylase/phosphopantothenate--cysteine ligase